MSPKKKKKRLKRREKILTTRLTIVDYGVSVEYLISRCCSSVITFSDIKDIIKNYEY